MSTNGSAAVRPSIVHDSIALAYIALAAACADRASQPKVSIRTRLDWQRNALRYMNLAVPMGRAS